MCLTYAAIFHFLFSILPFQNFWLPSKGKKKRKKAKAADSTPSVQMCNTRQTTGETEKQAHFKAMRRVG